MQLGIFAKTFARPTLNEVFSSVREHGFGCVQFNFACAGLPTLPQEIDSDLPVRIRSELGRCSLTMAAISGTCNLIHPRIAQRNVDLAKLENLIRHCPEMGTSVVTVCTGSRDPDDMWRGHSENHSPEAWRDLTEGLAQLLPAAEETGVALAIEPEPANVIDSAMTARKLLDQMQSPCLKIVFDAANLIRPQTLDQQTVLSRAFELLRADIVIAHAKAFGRNLTSDQADAGAGALNYNLFLSILKKSGFIGPLILHGIGEHEVDAAVRFLKAIWETS
jgi:sugar phosphate isomerase/epimerase